MRAADHICVLICVCKCVFVGTGIRAVSDYVFLYLSSHVSVNVFTGFGIRAADQPGLRIHVPPARGPANEVCALTCVLMSVLISVRCLDLLPPPPLPHHHPPPPPMRPPSPLDAATLGEAARKCSDCGASRTERRKHRRGGGGGGVKFIQS